MKLGHRRLSWASLKVAHIPSPHILLARAPWPHTAAREAGNSSPVVCPGRRTNYGEQLAIINTGVGPRHIISGPQFTHLQDKRVIPKVSFITDICDSNSITALILLHHIQFILRVIFQQEKKKVRSGLQHVR